MGSGEGLDLVGSGMQVLSWSSDQGETLGSSSSVKITPLLRAGSKVPTPDSQARRTVRRLDSALGQTATRHTNPRTGRRLGR